MTKIEQIEDCITRADKLQSNMTPLAWSVPALASLRGRHLLNNLGAISTRYLECGLHKSGTFCSTLCNNKLVSATGIDSFASDEFNEDKAEPQCMDNIHLIIQPETTFYFHKSDAFSLDLSLVEKGIDFYFYDASHSREDQKKALIYYKPVLDDEFIYGCDDWDYEEVKEGTMEGIDQGGYEILFQKELHGAIPGEHDNDSYWRGYWVALLKKKS